MLERSENPKGVRLSGTTNTIFRGDGSLLIKVISLPFNSALGGFDDEEVRDFLKDKELISCRDYLFVKNEIPYLVFVFKYYPAVQDDVGNKTTKKARKEESWKKTLSEHEMGLFNLLRDWRYQRCKKDGVPPYIILTNQQLSDIVKKRPQTASDLFKIEGIGKGKVDKYGEEILSISKVMVNDSDENSEAGINELSE